MRLDIQMKAECLERSVSINGHVELNVSDNFKAYFLIKRKS